MTRPIHSACSTEPAMLSDSGNAGLWFDKFCNKWSIERGSWTIKEGAKLTWIETVTGTPVGDSNQIDEQARRLVNLIESNGGRWKVYTTEARFVTGLGRSHPVENGFAWHPTLGTPFLPGSSIKGLVRSWARQEGRDRHESLLGTMGNAGGVFFLDACPLKPVNLEADIMTPHYIPWNVKNPPGDWRSPVPIPFLTTARDTPFLFGILPRRGPDNGGDSVQGGPSMDSGESDRGRGCVEEGDLDEVMDDWLCSALEWSGAGAKTAVGYGRFHHDRKRSLTLSDNLHHERMREEAAKSPEGRWLLEIDGKTELQVLELVRLHLDKEPLQDPDERRVFAKAVVKAHADWVQGWRSGWIADQHTNVGGKKLKERARLIYRAIGEDR